MKHLLEATQLIEEKHRNCRLAPMELHNEDGTVSVEVRFHGMVRLEKNETYRLERDRNETRREIARMSEERQLTHESLLSSFVESKKRDEQSDPKSWTSLMQASLMFSLAGERGWPIVTFEDFKKKHRVTGKDGILHLKIGRWDEDFQPAYVYLPDGRPSDQTKSEIAYSDEEAVSNVDLINV